MDFAQEQRNPARHLIGITIVTAAHVLAVYALATGLSHKVMEVVRGPLETKLIEEFKKPPPDQPPPPPPKLAPPPPPFIPPVEVNIAVAAPAANTITQVTSTRPAPVVPAAPKRVERVAPVIDAKLNCAKPEYPSASRRLDEAGTVTLRFLIDLDGHVLESKVETSSGFARLDEAARTALGRCRFKPGTVDGKPEQSWASIKYKWELE
jgi:protein TonB